ncbi:MAG: serine/threonine-protein kinase [Cyanobacteria bacterium P01_F01_bin.150]
MLGDLLDNRYRIIRTLSKGGFGQTYIAEDTRRPGCPRCVMKHLKPIVLEPGHLSNARRLFQTEAIALEKLGHHPQIPRLLAYFEENNDFYLVQDLIRGYPLTKELKAGFKWLEIDIYQLLYDVLSILIFVHDRGVIHRDIKPDNIIRQQLDRTLVLVDFGSVKQIRSHLHPNHETGQTISIGTIGYMSTEQAHGRPRPNSDLYSLGIIGIQAATGIKPKHFHEDSDTGELIWRNHANISDQLADFLEKMVAYHFKDRYLDARTALRALKQIKPDGDYRHSSTSDALLNKPSYWSLTASRLASAITTLKPVFQNPAVSQPTFIELPEPTQVSNSVADEKLDDTPAQKPDDLHQTMPMAYVAPLINSDADATTADFDDSEELAQAPVDVAVAEVSSEATSIVQEKEDETPVDYHHHDVPQFLAPVTGESLHYSAEKLPTAFLTSNNVLTSFLAIGGKIQHLFPLSHLRARGKMNEPEAYSQSSQIHTHQLQGRLPYVRPLFLVCGSLGVATLMLWSSQLGYQRIHAFWQQREALTEMQDHQREGRYSECQQTVQSLEQPSEALNALGYQCAFQNIRQLVKAEEWQKAIAIANSMPGDSNSRHHNEAQIFIRGQHILALEDAQEAGDIKQAMAIADEIEANHPLQSEIQLIRFKWQAEEKLWVESLDLLAQGKWHEASERVRPLEESPHFEERVKALLKEAELNQQQTTQNEAAIVTAPGTTQTENSPNSSDQIAPKNKPKP